jgi:hypothetical protein
MWATLLGVILIFVSLVVPSTHEGVYNIGMLQSQMMVFQAGLASLLIGAVAKARDMIIASIERNDPVVGGDEDAIEAGYEGEE